jgi:LuxR family transcriptional regulator, maltose regulon positive regulatory protein
MSEPLLLTKLYIPPPRSTVVLRPRLIERMNEGISPGSKLILISAPAGFGKTTLVSDWIPGPLHHPPGQVCGLPVAWLSLDEGDNDPNLFLTYLVAALQTLDLRNPSRGSESDGTAVDIGKGVVTILQSPQPPPIESILTALINEITTIPDNFVLVLDDYHVIDSKPVDEALTFLLKHLPPQMHIVITTREDPNLPLAQLRARGQLTELRAADLRFTPEEAGTFLNQMMNLNLSKENIAALETRTEGWIAGLQLAALSMQGHQDAASFIQSFTGSHYFVLDYLVEEVLGQQPEGIQAFLLRTSILDRLCGPLCDSILGSSSTSGQENLEYLERANLFIVPLDNERLWYRYHHLFGELLRKRIGQNLVPGEISRLHIQASEWYEQNGFPADAIHHAFAVEDFEHVAKLAELNWPAMKESVQSIKWLGWLKKLPEEIIRTRPVLCVNCAWAFLNAGELEAAEAKMQDAEYWLEPTTITGDKSDASSIETCPERSRRMVVVDEEQFKSLPVVLATARAYHAQAIGDISGTIKYAQRVLDLSPEGESQLPGVASSLLGLAQYASGNLDAAYRAFSDGMAKADPYAAISGNFVLAGIKLAQGQLNTALSIYEKALKLVLGRGEPMPLGTEELYSGISELHRERGDLETAEQDLLTGRMLGEQVELPDWQHRWFIAKARLYESKGDLVGALDLLEEAERRYVRTPVPIIRPIAALKTRIRIAQGKIAEALDWVHTRDLSVDDDVSYLREFEHMTLARVLIAQEKRGLEDGSIHDAKRLLKRLLQAAEEGRRMGSVIEISSLLSLAHAAQGDIPMALASLERALTLAKPEGYLRLFVDEGLPMVALLQEAAKHGIDPNYVRQLLAAFGKAEGKTSVTQLMIEPLSEREFEVLRLLRTDLDGPEIARELMVSLSTLRTHTQNIFAKLGVNNRRTAVHRAEELNLL